MEFPSFIPCMLPDPSSRHHSAWKSDRWTAIESPDTVVVHPLDGEIYANIINISTSYDVFFHAAHEVPDITQQRYSFSGSDYTTVELEALEIISSRDAKALRISQRKCRFTEEARNLVTSPVYSFIICRIECRLKLALRLCNCIPHFYRRKGGCLLVGPPYLPCHSSVAFNLPEPNSIILK